MTTKATEPVEAPLDDGPLDAPTGFFDRVHRDESPPVPSAEQSPIGTVRRRPQPLGSGSVTPSGRRSVQFVREASETEPAPSPLKRTPTWETEDEGGDKDEAAKHARERRERQASFIGRLKAMASPASSSFHVRTASNNTTATGMVTPTAALSPQSERSEPLYPVLNEEDNENGDADAEEDSNDERKGSSLRVKRRHKTKRPQLDGPAGSVSTPRTSRFASFIKEHQISSSSHRPESSFRRATMSDIGEDTRRAGVSEDEGRDKIRNAWKRGIDGARAISYNARRLTESEDNPGEKRPSNLRRFTGMDAMSSSIGRMRTDRVGSGSGSTQRWRQVKQGLKMLGQKKRDERATVDYQKSAQLMAELLAGAPAALVFASMFQRDEHNNRKIPVLLEQLKIRIPASSTKETKSGDRHMIFRIELEYGNGPSRMNWVIHRNLRDFVNLHLKYKVQGKTEKLTLRSDDKTKPKIPHFPKTAFPYARGARGLFDGLDDEPDEDEIPEETAREPETPGLERPGKHRRRRSSFVLARRQSSIGDGEFGGNTAEREARERNIYNERQRKKLEKYLQQMIRWLIFRPDSTRLCKFLELSALAMRLSSEGGYVGKQGLLSIASRQPKELTRTAMRMQTFTDRHKPRWALVRHSYIVMVDGPESLVPYEVFLVDSDFSTDKDIKGQPDKKLQIQEMTKNVAEKTSSKANHHILRLYNAERKLKLVARNERQYSQFKESIEHMASNTVWSKKQRFGSFAPTRENVWCRWLVDARDHMWQVSRAIDNAKDCIYIHDWWLSPELYLRRPAAISQKWRLDRLLQRKANEGVKIFVVVYRNIESAIPIDSEYTKWSLLDLHENICVQRSPNQFRQNQFFWAHHEKLVVVDNMMAFVGGVDLCFGRWDDPCHALTDDKLTGFELDHEGPRDAEHCQVWPGKDYSNPRVQDFYALDRPYEEMYDRTKVPRMPWHDISMQLIGQPARDVGRHFVQRWNYVLRGRIPTRPTPILMPPPEYEHGELERLGMTGTCQVQILRSCSPWSIGTPNKVEHSIMNAYCSLIESSDHFVYIENQFYISSTTVDGTIIHNGIGDALVERAIRAAENGEDWQACLIIPLMPGFQNSVDSQDGTSVRLIMQCQYRSINRGEGSLFGRLKAAGLNPERYIKFFSLRQWGKIGPKKCLTTEQLYIHAKCMVVDDRHVIIGSANINERSMLGSRDSEVASVVTDRMMIPSYMAGRPYMVGEFAHGLRMRLMREHLGLDVDAIYRRDQLAKEHKEQDLEMERIYREDFATPATGREDYFHTPPQTPQPHALTNHNLEASANGFAGEKTDLKGWVNKTHFGRSDSDDSERPNKRDNGEKQKKGSTDLKQHDLDVDGYGVDNERQLEMAGDIGLRDTYINTQGHEVFRSKDAPDIQRIKQVEDAHNKIQREDDNGARNVPRPPWPLQRNDTYELGLAPRYQLPELPTQDDTDIGGPPLTHQLSRVTTRKTVAPLLHTLQRAEITENCMQDPLAPNFMQDIWQRVAENNTKIYRQVFRTMPDSEVLDWDDYKRFENYNERFMQSQGLGHSKPKPPKEAPPRSGPPGSAGTDSMMNQMLDEKTLAGKRGIFSNLTNKVRPSSKKSNESTVQSQELNEKVGDSPESGISRAPTAVPTPDDRPLDEKEAAKEADALHQTEAEALEKESLSLAPQTSRTEPTQVEDPSVSRHRTITIAANTNGAPETTATQSNTNNGPGLQHATSQKRRRRATTKSSARPTMVEEVMSKEDAEELLNMVQGHLVQWPYDW
jgi:phospholipase D1/2